MVFNTKKEAISKLYGINECSLKKIASFGLGNDGIYAYKDKAFKISSERKEFFVCQRLLGRDFHNVVNVYSANECDIRSENDSVWHCYIIEQEKLYKKRDTPRFGFLRLDKLAVDVNERLPYFIGIINGIAELSSVGIIHNDLHSLNILFDKDNNPKIIDFGIATIKKKFEPAKYFARLETINERRSKFPDKKSRIL